MQKCNLFVICSYRLARKKSQFLFDFTMLIHAVSIPFFFDSQLIVIKLLFFALNPSWSENIY